MGKNLTYPIAIRPLHFVVLRSLIGHIRACWQRHRVEAQLARLPAHTLRDIGREDLIVPWPKPKSPNH